MIDAFILLLPCSFGLLAFWLSDNLIIAISIALIYLLSAFFLLKPWMKSLYERRRKRKESFRFISSFVISLALTGSLEKSYDGAISDASGEFGLVVKGIESEAVRDRIVYLNNYFEMESYRMFLSLYSL